VEVFVHIAPNYFNQLSPLVVLTLTAIVTHPLTDHMEQRLVWLNAALDSLDPSVSLPPLCARAGQVLTLSQQPEIAGDILARILAVIQTRLQEAYMAIAEHSDEEGGNGDILRAIAILNNKVLGLKNDADVYARDLASRPPPPRDTEEEEDD
jgi:hypothetical protein